MPFVDRDNSGAIICVFVPRQRDDQEFIADDHADMIAWRRDQQEALMSAGLQRVEKNELRKAMISKIKSGSPLTQEDIQAVIVKLVLGA